MGLSPARTAAFETSRKNPGNHDGEWGPGGTMLSLLLLTANVDVRLRSVPGSRWQFHTDRKKTVLCSSRCQITTITQTLFSMAPTDCEYRSVLPCLKNTASPETQLTTNLLYVHNYYTYIPPVINGRKILVNTDTAIKTSGLMSNFSNVNVMHIPNQ